MMRLRGVKIRLSTEALGLVSCFRAGDSFSRNEGLVTIAFACFSRFPKKKSFSAKFW